MSPAGTAKAPTLMDSDAGEEEAAPPHADRVRTAAAPAAAALRREERIMGNSFRDGTDGIENQGGQRWESLRAAKFPSDWKSWTSRISRMTTPNMYSGL